MDKITKYIVRKTDAGKVSYLAGFQYINWSKPPKAIWEPDGTVFYNTEQNAREALGEVYREGNASSELYEVVPVVIG